VPHTTYTAASQRAYSVQLTAIARSLASRIRSNPARFVALALLLVTLACIVIPFSPVLPAAPLDDSWALGLNHALAEGRVFGRDILFTFGPYSNVFSMAYHPATDGLMMFASAYLAVGYWFAVVQLTRDSKPSLPWGILVVLAAVMSGRDARDALLMSYPLLVGLVCFRIAIRSSELPARFTPVVIGVLASTFGLLSLIKGSMMIACGLIAVGVVALLLIHKQWRFAVALVVSPVLALAGFWLLAGQPISALADYIRSFSPIISGYTEAMAIPGDTSEIVIYLIGCAILLTAVLAVRGTSTRPRIILCGIFAAFLFVAFKAGFVRHDSHALIPAQGLLLAAVLFAGAFEARLGHVVVVASALIWGYVHHHYIDMSPRAALAKVVNTYADATAGLRKRLAADWPEQEFHARLDWLKRSSRIPALEGTTDIYSYRQAELISSENRWNPRPMIQSYAAYNSYLADRNRAHLLGSTPPENVVFRVEFLDHRLPALDDGASWPVLLARYRPVSFDDGMLILRRRPEVDSMAELMTIKTQTGRLGKPVAVPQVDSFVFVEIAVKPTLLGKLASAVFKTDALLIQLNLANGQSKTYRYVAGLGRSGLVLSPLVENTAELTALYAAGGSLNAKQVTSFVITPAESTRLWKPRFQITFKRVTSKPVLGARQLWELISGDQQLDQIHRGAGIDGVLDPAGCDGVIDDINDFRPPPGDIPVSGLLSVSGWTARSVTEANIPEGVVLVLTDEQGQHTLFDVRKTQRPDVSAFFNDHRLDPSGFTTRVDVSKFEGRYTLAIAFEEAGRIELCPRLTNTLVLTATPPLD
jgi:hypothetical protein